MLVEEALADCLLVLSIESVAGGGIGSRDSKDRFVFQWVLPAKEKEHKPQLRSLLTALSSSLSLYGMLYYFCSGLLAGRNIPLCGWWNCMKGCSLCDEILEEWEAGSDPGPADTSTLLLRTQPILVCKPFLKSSPVLENRTTSSPLSWLRHLNFSL